MATALKYFDTAKIAHLRLTTGVTATDGSGSITDMTWIGGAPSGDWMLVKAIITASSATGVGNPADCLVQFFADDATTLRKIRTVDLGDPAVGSVILGEYLAEINFGPEFIFPTAINIACSVSVTPTAGNIDIVFLVQAA